VHTSKLGRGEFRIQCRYPGTVILPFWSLFMRVKSREQGKKHTEAMYRSYVCKLCMVVHRVVALFIVGVAQHGKVIEKRSTRCPQFLINGSPPPFYHPLYKLGSLCNHACCCTITHPNLPNCCSLPLRQAPPTTIEILNSPDDYAYGLRACPGSGPGVAAQAPCSS
jgi:hypothetical protein